ncbi:uncharacterized protein LOC119671167 [Teleopsis dalmanni]|uniref:uncharacterized protein LOC119671167 n=1 Tax=Teleopsis dalmanni TaxID=139649 RepID=UPI0018CDFB8C|nr:uncharacterized protein LOC119671167 [Teleopsis dalmanni]
MQTKYLMCIFFVIVTLLSNLCAPVESKVIFYNKNPTVRTGQLLVTHKRSKPCPKGQMRDHRERCRRAIIFGK